MRPNSPCPSCPAVADWWGRCRRARLARLPRLKRLPRRPTVGTNPFASEVLENFCLNGRGSDKETRHLKLAIEGSGLCFEPGDSLGIYPHNDPRLVDNVIAHMGWDPQNVHSCRQAGIAAPRGTRSALRDYASE